MASKSTRSDESTDNFTSTSRRSIVLSPEELEIWELYYYAGLTMDPQVFHAIYDLIRMDIHPKAVMEVLESIVKQSKYYSPAQSKDTASKSDSSIQSAASRPKSPTSSTNRRSLKSSSDGPKSDSSRTVKKSRGLKST